jgi:hypothetical protein
MMKLTILFFLLSGYTCQNQVVEHVFEILDVSLEIVSDPSYTLLTVPPLKYINYSAEDGAFWWLSLNITTVFELGNEPLLRSIFQRFCKTHYSRRVQTSQSHPDIVTKAVPLVKINIIPLTENSANKEYFLNINADVIEIFAHTKRGILHGLSTLSQLLESPMPISLPVHIQDGPDVSWRGALNNFIYDVALIPLHFVEGLMVDVVRHYIPIPHLRRTIDAMAAAKLNILHLHLTDSQVCI